MADPIDDEPTTLADRLAESNRSATAHDLEVVVVFLYETLGRWYELKPGGRPPSVQPHDIAVGLRPSAAVDVETGSESPSGLLDPGEVLELTSAEGGDNDGTAVDDTDVDDLGATSVDERDGVLAASEVMALIALGRPRDEDESWDDVGKAIESEHHPALAYALWVGLAGDPQARYRSLGVWRRSITAALRSDAADATVLEHGEPPSRIGAVAIGAVVLVVAAIGLLLIVRDTPAEDLSVGTAEIETDDTDDTVTDQPAESSDTVIAGDDAVDDTADDERDSAESGGDRCEMVGPLGPVTVDQVSDRAIVIAWAPSTEAVNILLEGVFVDTVPADAFRYVIEHLPLSDEPLSPAADYTVSVEPRSGLPSTACATTLANPVPGSEALIGVSAPTGLAVVETSATSITVTWDPRTGADSHNLYLDGVYLQVGDVGGSSTIGDETEFTFLDLEPDTTYEIGIRRIEGPNQSGVATITASTDPG